MSLQLAAQHLAAQGRGPDKQLVHMTTGELRSLQDLARAHGTSLTTNPVTGLPEAFKLKDLLPLAAGVVLGPAGLGLSAAQAGLAAGAIGTLASGSLEKGIMAGLGAYGGAGLSAGLLGAGTQAAADAAIAGNLASTVGEPAIAAAEAAQAAQASPFSTMGKGISALADSSGRDTFMKNIGGGSGLLKYGLASAAPALLAPPPQPTTPMPGPSTPVPKYLFERRLNPSGSPSYFTDRYTRLAEGGPVADMSAANVYDMQNARGGVSDMGIDNSTGMQRMADGGVTDPYSGNAYLNMLKSRTSPGYQSPLPTTDEIITGTVGVDFEYVYDPITKTYKKVRKQKPGVPDVSALPGVSGIDTAGGGLGMGTPDASVAANPAATIALGQALQGYGQLAFAPGATIAGLIGSGLVNSGITALGEMESQAATDASTAATLGQAVADAFGVAYGGAGFNSSGAGGISGVGGNIGDALTGGSTVGIDAMGPGGPSGDVSGGSMSGADHGAGIDGSGMYARGGSISHLGDYSDGGRLLRGPVEAMSYANVYDMQNARGGVSDMGVDMSTGMERMAEGGITGSGELNLNIPLNFGGGSDFGGRFNQGPLDFGQNRTGFGQAAANGYQSVGSGASSSPPGFLAPKPSSTVGLTENPFNLGTQLASRLGSANQNPFAAQPTTEMMAAQREATPFNPAFDLADLQRRVGDREESFNEFENRRRMRRHPGDQVPTAAELQSEYKDYVQDRNNNLAKIGDLQQVLSRQAQQKEMFDRINAMQQQIPQMAEGGETDPTKYKYERGAGGLDSAVDASGEAMGMARGGISDLGDYSDGGRLLRGPGDGVSDSIPAMIGRKQPARLADGEFVVPARIVSELGNGSTEAGARKLYAMMDRIQKARGKTVGKGKVAKNSRAEKYLPA